MEGKITPVTKVGFQAPDVCLGLVHLEFLLDHAFYEPGEVATAAQIFDSDDQGKNTAQFLREGLYAGEANLLLEMESFTGMADSEIEDLILMPAEVIARELDRWLCNSDVPFADEMQTGKPIVPQIEAWAAHQKIQLAKPGWKVELAKRVKQRLLAEGPEALSPDVLSRWDKLFAAFQTARAAVAVAAKASA